MAEKVIDIGKIYFIKDNENTKMCSDIRIGNRKHTTWFSLKNEQAKYFCERSDAFIMAFLLIAMRKGYDIVCHNVISKKLHYQLNHYVIPILSDEMEIYKKITVHADTIEEFETENAIGTALSGGVDSLYTVMTHGKDCEYPVTHLTLFNMGSLRKEDPKKKGEIFPFACEKVKEFAKEQNLQTIFVDTNLEQDFEYFSTAITFRNIACALAIQKLLGKYYISSSRKVSEFELDSNCCESYDLLVVPLASTESLTFYLAGQEKTRIEKIEAISEWNVSYKWLHPCIYGSLGEKNCGHCSKCYRDLATLWYLGKLDNYREVFDIDEYKEKLNINLAYTLANCRGKLNKNVSELLDSMENLPQEVRQYAKYFKMLMKRNLELKEKIQNINK